MCTVAVAFGPNPPCTQHTVRGMKEVGAVGTSQWSWEVGFDKISGHESAYCERI